MHSNILPTLSQYTAFSFSGSRYGSRAASIFIPAFAAMFSTASVRVGCASGVDALVRDAFPSAGVFRAGPRRWELAARSARLVRASGSAGGLLIAFPSSYIVPSGCIVGRSFRGGGSGTWGSVALALGLGYPVIVWCPSLTASPPLPGLSRLWSSPPGFPVQGSWWYSAGSVSSAAPTLFG